MLDELGVVGRAAAGLRGVCGVDVMAAAAPGRQSCILG